eukprot:SAG31_NODE_15017_length_775_cov_1.088757_1_plen_30_part_10
MAVGWCGLRLGGGGALGCGGDGVAVGLGTV